MTNRTLFLLPAACPLPALAQVQSAMHPRGSGAERIAEISWVLFVGGGLIFIVVMALAGIAVFGSERRRSFLARQKLVIAGGVLFPVVTLTALLVYMFSSGAFGTLISRPAARIEVTGELWWWRVRYLDAEGKVILETANEIRIPAGQAVEFLVKSNDVIHSFWVPNLAGKIDMLPGQVNRIQVEARAPGVFRGQCAEYCGAQHAKMAFHVVALAQADYDAWIASQAKPAREPGNGFALRGRQLFLQNRCGQCHAVRGIEANGTSGPDLTHFGSRQFIAAGILPNNAGAVAGWIAGSQLIKPGNKMPSFNQFNGDELRALAAYLEQLQ